MLVYMAIAGVDLAHIARTSYGIAQSPPSNNTNGMLSMSPTQAKGGFVSYSSTFLVPHSCPADEAVKYTLQHQVSSHQ